MLTRVIYYCLNHVTKFTKMTNEQIIIYQTPDGQTAVDVKLTNNNIWLNQYQLADLFATDRTSILKHIKNVYSSGSSAGRETQNYTGHQSLQLRYDCFCWLPREFQARNAIQDSYILRVLRCVIRPYVKHAPSLIEIDSKCSVAEIIGDSLFK
jgi:hypothetical protein